MPCGDRSLSWTLGMVRDFVLRKDALLTCICLPALTSNPPGPTTCLSGEHLNVVYVCMLLAGSMPIAYAAAALWFISAYWCDKVELLSLSRRPITYGADLSNMVMRMLPFAAVRQTGYALHNVCCHGSKLLLLLLTGALVSLLLLLTHTHTHAPKRAVDRSGTLPSPCGHSHCLA